MQRLDAPSRRGVTLIEIVVVITIVGILSITVLPSFARTDEARRASGIAEVQRLLAYARERAIASGRPVGAMIVQDDQRIELVTIDGTGNPVPLADPLGRASVPVRLGDRFGLSIDRVIIPPPSVAGSSRPGMPVIWFDHRGRPHMRSDAGVYIADSSGDSVIEFEGRVRVVVTPRTGMIGVERP
jgi:prepilin-type N-terminal cleavage/methylation domain-containing protein